MVHTSNGITSFELYMKRESNQDLLKVFYFASYISVGISLGFYFSTKKKKERKKNQRSLSIYLLDAKLWIVVLQPNSASSTLTTE